MKSYPFVSIIIPTWRNREVLDTCLDSLWKLTYPKDRFEAILLSQEKLQLPGHANMKVVHLDQNVGYAQARNHGAKVARGEILAFIDDDCVVPPDWLRRAVRFFEKDDIALVGGPAIPFENDLFRYRMGGYLFAAPFVTGVVSSRYKSLSDAFETDGEHLIMANNLTKKSAFEDVSGIDANQAPGEDGYFYFKLRQKKYKLLYAPGIFVWHRAKPILWPMLSKIFYYAVGRGGLVARNFHTTDPTYLIPSLFFLGILGLGILSFFNTVFLYILGAVLAVYVVSNLVNALYMFFMVEKHPLLLFVAAFVTPLVHFTYGIGVLYGIYLYVSGRFQRGGIKMWTKD